MQVPQLVAGVAQLGEQQTEAQITGVFWRSRVQSTVLAFLPLKLKLSRAIVIIEHRILNRLSTEDLFVVRLRHFREMFFSSLASSSFPYRELVEKSSSEPSESGHEKDVSVLAQVFTDHG